MRPRTLALAIPPAFAAPAALAIALTPSFRLGSSYLSELGLGPGALAFTVACALAGALLIALAISLGAPAPPRTAAPSLRPAP